MPNGIVSTDKAPKAIGPYSQAVIAGDLIFTSGQIPLDPATQQLVQVVKATIFVTDLGDFATVNEVYGKRFPRSPPARSTVQVAALPKGARVEIELIARR